MTAREQQVAELIDQGLTNQQIADQLGISPGTVKIHKRKLRMVQYHQQQEQKPE